jgi:dTDP-glucose 4,6-dehydratase
MRVLVTGGAGFVGSHYVRTLVSGGYPSLGPVEVTVFDRLTGTGSLDNLAPVRRECRVVQGDVCDAALLDEVLPGQDVVVDFAAEADEGAVGTNVLGVQTLLDACLRAGTGRVVHIGSGSVYGPVAAGASGEDAALSPRTPHAATRAAGDLIAQAYARAHGLAVTIVRAPNDYGPYHAPEQPVPGLITDLLDGLSVRIPDDATDIHQWVHVDDHCRAVQLVLERGRAGEVYNVGSPTELTLRELAEKLLPLVRRSAELAVAGPGPGQQRERWALADPKIRALGYRPLVEFDEGLVATVAWYADNESWWRPRKDKIGSG